MRHFSEQQVSCLVIQLSWVSPPRAFNYAGAAHRTVWKGEPLLFPYQQHYNRQIQRHLYNVENHVQHRFHFLSYIDNELGKRYPLGEGLSPLTPTQGVS